MASWSHPNIFYSSQHEKVTFSEAETANSHRWQSQVKEKKAGQEGENEEERLLFCFVVISTILETGTISKVRLQNNDGVKVQYHKEKRRILREENTHTHKPFYPGQNKSLF